MDATRTICFVPTVDPKRAKEFFSRSLGLKLLSEDNFALVYETPGAMLRVVTVQELDPAAFTILGWIVDDIAGSVDNLKSKGVQFQIYDGMKQDEKGIWTSPSGARIAWFSDADGNILSLTQM